jgi:hypothetical protein
MQKDRSEFARLDIVNAHLGEEASYQDPFVKATGLLVHLFFVLR